MYVWSLSEYLAHRWIFFMPCLHLPKLIATHPNPSNPWLWPNKASSFFRRPFRIISQREASGKESCWLTQAEVWGQFIIKAARTQERILSLWPGKCCQREGGKLKWVGALIWQMISIRLNFYLPNLEQKTACYFSEWALNQCEWNKICSTSLPAF